MERACNGMVKGEIANWVETNVFSWQRMG